MNRSNEDGIAMVLAMFMVLIMSTLGVSLMFTSQTETWSSQNYKMMSQARYAAESGVQRAANHLMFTYVPPTPTNVNDPIANYGYQYVTPVTVTANNNQAVLATDVATANYPIAAVRTAFSNATTGSVPIDNGVAQYTVSARLVSMENFLDYIKKNVTLQTWQITGTGTIPGARTGETSVTALLERPKQPAFGYAAFATDNGCGALTFGGGATTDSYDSRDPLVAGAPHIDDFGGAVGTNGNLSEVGNTTLIKGTLSTPRSGVGNCTANNVTAESLSDPNQVQGGLIELAQPITFPTPDLPNPMPPTGNVNFGNGAGACAGVNLTAPVCTVVSGNATLDPAQSGGHIEMADLAMNGGDEVHLKAGTYNVNSITQNGGATLVIDSGPVIINIAGVGQTTPLKLNGGGIVNTSAASKFDPMNLQFIYAGTQELKLAGGADTCALIYAPNATSNFNGTQTDFYGAVVTKTVTEMGGAKIHYDRRLGGEAFIAGNWTLSAFTWKKY
jgi:Tfp pilus assembly protein PilX